MDHARHTKDTKASVVGIGRVLERFASSHLVSARFEIVRALNGIDRSQGVGDRLTNGIEGVRGCAAARRLILAPKFFNRVEVGAISGQEPHSSSEILDLYYHLHDADSQAAMQALAGGGEAGPGDVQIDDAVTSSEMPDTPAEGTLRATGASTIEKSSQDELEKQLTELLFPETERAGFDQAQLSYVLTQLLLRLKNLTSRDLRRLECLLKEHGFLPS